MVPSLSTSYIMASYVWGLNRIIAPNALDFTPAHP
jgi:hypothetical protein